MIVMALANPVAFVLAIGAGVLLQYGYEWTGRGMPSDWALLGVALGAYFVGMALLPWWVRPIQLYRWWQQK